MYPLLDVLDVVDVGRIGDSRAYVFREDRERKYAHRHDDRRAKPRAATARSA
jgi:serine/threonine protein phosphatase PrpC